MVYWDPMLKPNGVIFSVVIPTYERPKELQECLKRLAPDRQLGGCLIGPDSFRTPDQSGYDFCYEVIVSDDGINKESQSLVSGRFSWAHWVQGPGKGPASNRNTGARLANGTWLVFLDDDCLPQAGLLRAYYEIVRKHPEMPVLEGSIEPNRPKRLLRETAPINLEGGYLWSCNFAIKKVFFQEQLKGFCEEFPYPCMEDVDLRERIRKLGVNFPFCTEARVIHPWRIKNLRLRNDLGIKKFSHLLYYSRHPEKKLCWFELIKKFGTQFNRDLIDLVRFRNYPDLKYFTQKQSIHLLLIIHVFKWAYFR